MNYFGQTVCVLNCVCVTVWLRDCVPVCVSRSEHYSNCSQLPAARRLEQNEGVDVIVRKICAFRRKHSNRGRDEVIVLQVWSQSQQTRGKIDAGVGAEQSQFGRSRARFSLHAKLS